MAQKPDRPVVCPGEGHCRTIASPKNRDDLVSQVDPILILLTLVSSFSAVRMNTSRQWRIAKYEKA